MPGTFRAAAIQESSVWLDRDATTAKACSLIREAGRNGANVIALPESFIPGFPYWVLAGIKDESGWHRRLHDEAVEVPGESAAALAAVAADIGATVVVGVTERDPGKIGTLYNTNLVFGPDGYLGKHRKLVPTCGERMVWTGGDGSTLRVFPTEFGPLGTLNCGENVNTLARYTLLADGERIHVANFPSCVPAPSPANNTNDVYIPAASHAYEGRLFNIVAQEYGTPEVCATLGVPYNPDIWNCTSGIIGPDGDWINMLRDEPGIVYADCNTDITSDARLYHDIVGHYNRFDVFHFEVDRSERRPMWEKADDRSSS